MSFEYDERAILKNYEGKRLSEKTRGKHTKNEDRSKTIQLPSCTNYVKKPNRSSSTIVRHKSEDKSFNPINQKNSFIKGCRNLSCMGRSSFEHRESKRTNSSVRHSSSPPHSKSERFAYGENLPSVRHIEKGHVNMCYRSSTVTNTFQDSDDDHDYVELSKIRVKPDYPDGTDIKYPRQIPISHSGGHINKHCYLLPDHKIKNSTSDNHFDHRKRSNGNFKYTTSGPHPNTCSNNYLNFNHVPRRNPPSHYNSAESRLTSEIQHISNTRYQGKLISLLHSQVPEVEQNECKASLIGNGWNLQLASERLKLEILQRYVSGSKDKLRMLLIQHNWDLPSTRSYCYKMRAMRSLQARSHTLHYYNSQSQESLTHRA